MEPKKNEVEIKSATTINNEVLFYYVVVDLWLRYYYLQTTDSMNAACVREWKCGRTRKWWHPLWKMIWLCRLPAVDRQLFAPWLQSTRYLAAEFLVLSTDFGRAHTQNLRWFQNMLAWRGSGILDQVTRAVGRYGSHESLRSKPFWGFVLTGWPRTALYDECVRSTVHATRCRVRFWAITKNAIGKPASRNRKTPGIVESGAIR